MKDLMTTASGQERLLRPWAVVIGFLAVALLFRWFVADTAVLVPEAIRRFEQVYGIPLPHWYETTRFFSVWAKGDGQAFVAIAADPLLKGPATVLAILDIRYSRVGYSLVGLGLALGRTPWIPVGLFLANVASLSGFAWIVAKRAQRFGRLQWWLLANPALLIAFASDTAELMGLTLALWTLTYASVGGAGIVGASLGLVRPEMLAVSAAGRRPAVSLAAGGVLAAASRIFVAIRVGDTGSDAMNVSPPGFGYFEALPDLTRWGAVVVAAVFVGAVVTIYQGLTREKNWRRLGWVGYGLLILMLSNGVISSAPNLLRVAGGLPLLWLAGRGWSPDDDQGAPAISSQS